MTIETKRAELLAMLENPESVTDWRKLALKLAEVMPRPKVSTGAPAPASAPAVSVPATWGALKDRRKPWQKACVAHKFSRCGAMLADRVPDFRKRFGPIGDRGSERLTDAVFVTIGMLEEKGLEADTPLRFRP